MEASPISPRHLPLRPTRWLPRPCMYRVADNSFSRDAARSVPLVCREVSRTAPSLVTVFPISVASKLRVTGTSTEDMPFPPAGIFSRTVQLGARDLPAETASPGDPRTPLLWPGCGQRISLHRLTAQTGSDAVARQEARRVGSARFDRVPALCSLDADGDRPKARTAGLVSRHRRGGGVHRCRGRGFVTDHLSAPKVLGSACGTHRPPIAIGHRDRPAVVAGVERHAADLPGSR